MISTFNSKLDSWPKPGASSVEGLFAYLSRLLPDDRAKDEYPTWSPAVWPPGCRRAKATVERVSCLVADVDDGTPLEDALAGFPKVRLLAHSSYSHTPEKPKYRIVIPLATPIPADVFPRAWAWLAERFGCMDGACSDASRVYFVPVARPDAWHVVHDGPLLEPPPGGWESLPDPTPRTRARPPMSWVPTPDRPTWSPRPTDYPDELVARAIETWRMRLAMDVEHIAKLKEGRRAAIRISAFYLGRYLWLDASLLRSLDEALRAAAGDRLDDNIVTLLEACVTDSATKPGPIEDLVTPGLSEHVALPLVVKRNASIWALRRDDRTYEGPGDPTDALGWLRERGDVPVVSSKGKTLAWNDIFHRVGVTARDVVYTYPRPDGTIPRVWDPVSRTLATTLAHPPAVVPRQHAQVATWLALGLSETDHATRDAVLDWLVTAWGPALDQPSAVLYIEGPGGGGKTMLAHALASPWRRAPLPMGTGMQQFNEPLLRCPLLHLDEGEGTSEVNADALRSMFSIREQRIEIKRGAVVALLSSLRGMICANNGRALTFPEIPTLDDLDAIAERILHVWWSAAAKGYLVRLGEEGTKGWVTSEDGGPGKIAEHLAWLATTRRVVPGSRWVVGGIRGAYHDDLVLQVPLSGAILAGVVAGAKDNTFPLVETATGPGYSVLAKTLQARWLTLVTDGSRQPTMHSLTAGLGALSRSHGAGVWVVDAGLVARYAASLGIDLGT